MVLKQEKTGNSYVRIGNFLILILLSMILMSSAASAAANGTILVASNRYVVQDDPNTGSFSGTGFKNPSNNWNSNLFSGSETTITMWAMVMDKNGTPIPNTNVNFTLKNPAGTVDYTLIKSTDSNGLVNLSRDLNAKNYYGKWQIIANATSLGLNDSTSFIYNWWGCGGGAGCSGHGSETLASGAAINSPYTSGHDAAVNAKSAHYAANVCMYCHLSYNGQGSTANMNTSDTHRNISCDNASCHGSITLHRTNMVIGSCSNCHNRTDISDKNTLNGIVSNYSNSTSSTYNRYHTPNSTVPCIICHGPMHNITKPDDSQRFIKNNDTESSQCTTCHSTYSKHNGGVNCTLCHSDDVHAIKVFAQNATYVTLNHNNPNPARGNCTNCHQNSTFLTILKSQPSAGNYTGSAVQILKPLNHSTDRAGSKWGTYWTSQKDACIYCHGDNKHNATRLGDASVAVGSDTIGGPIGTGTVCSSCHDQSDSNYNAVIALLIPNPVANQPGTNWNVTGTDHASYGTTDAVCLTCHNNSLSGSADITDFVHNVGVGKGGGPDCVSCHDIGASQEKVDVSKMNTSLSIHNTLNSGATVTRADNKRCYACHTNSSVSADGVVNQAELPTSGHPDSYKVPKNCMDCHDKGNFSALIVKEHNSAGTEILTKPYANTNNSCVNCHNKTEMIISNSDPEGPKSEFAKVSHYGSNKTGVSPYNTGGASNCTYCHQSNSAFTTEMVNASWNSNIGNHTDLSANPECSNCHNSGRIHDSTLTKPVLTLPNSSYCQGCHATVQKHNNSVNCTQCHLASNKNIHPVQYLQPSGTFLNNSVPNKASAINCTSCHQGTLSGFSTATQVKTPLSHSIDNGGQKWGNYWTSQKDACLYCHGNSKHNTSGLGKALTPIGTDPIGGAIGSGTLCSSCHDSTDSDYAATMALLIPNPVANQPGNNWNVTGTDHASYGSTDADCKTCHGGVLSGLADISEFVHNVNIGSGGTDCISCHIQATGTGGIYPAINIASFTKHRNVNTTDGNNNLTNSDCTTCHTDITNMTNSGFTVTTKTCTNCHNTSGTFAAPTISNHRPNGINISTPASCSTCHNNSINATYAYSTDASSGHYGTRTNLISTKDCTNCHKSPANASTWGEAQDPASNATFPHSISNTPKEECYACHTNISTSDFHNVSLVKPALSTVNCLDCHATTRTMAPKKIDSSVFSAGVHKNRACENCHANATDTNMNTYSFSTDSAKTCTYCHTGSVNFGAPLIAEHNQVGQNIITPLATCNTCHDNSGMYLANAGTNGTTTAITHYLKDVTNTGTDPYQHLGPLNTSNCIDCHNGPNTSNPIWGNPVNISTAPRPHNETETGQCDTCHNDGTVSTLAKVDFHNAALQMPSGGSCTGCHGSTVGPSLGLHSNLSGTPAVEDSDCQTCHFASFTMATGAANSSNTHYCQDCHTTLGTGPVKSTLLKDGTNHGSADCKWCHAAGNQPAYKYHAIGPRGTATGTNCLTCHYYANLVDEPFKAPGEIHSGDIEGCIYCHDPADNHIVTPSIDTSSTTLQSVSVTTPITSGNPVLIQATVYNPMVMIAAAQYQVTNISGTVIPWTNMNPFDGSFNSGTEVVNATIGTSNLIGTYTVNIKGMASAPKSGGGPYSPLNGQWSGQSSTQFIVTQSKGYVNGTIRNNSVNISGAIVTTNTGVTAVSDANGFYSLNLVTGTYQLTTIKNPEYYTNSSVSVTVTAPATLTRDIILNKKPTGTISGKVSVK